MILDQNAQNTLCSLWLPIGDSVKMIEIYCLRYCNSAVADAAQNSADKR